SGGADRPAEDSGGANGGEEHAFVMRIARLVGADHLVALGQARLEHAANLRMNAARRLPKNRRQIRATQPVRGSSIQYNVRPMSDELRLASPTSLLAATHPVLRHA